MTVWSKRLSSRPSFKLQEEYLDTSELAGTHLSPRRYTFPWNVHLQCWHLAVATKVVITHILGVDTSDLRFKDVQILFLKLETRAHTELFERDNPYYFFPANQHQAGTKIYSLTQCSLTVNECDRPILAGNDQRINTQYLTRRSHLWRCVQILFLELETRAHTELSRSHLRQCVTFDVFVCVSRFRW